MKAVVIGTGRMGRRHIQVVKEMNLNLVGISDVNPESLTMAEREQGVSTSMHFLDTAEMLAKTRPEVVVISTTAPTHASYTRMAVEAGARFVLCEKPMAISIAECNEMVELCRANGVGLGINHQMRFMAQYVEPKKIMSSEAIGGLCSVTVIAGNFGAAMNGSHYFEMFRYMTDENPVDVSAWFSTTRLANPRGPQFEDKAGCIRMTTPSGKRFYMDFSEDQGHGLTVIYGGRYGQVIVNELNGVMYSMAREDQYRGLPTTRYGMPAILQTFPLAPTEVIAPTKATLTALLEGRNYPTGEDGKQVVATLVAAFISNENWGRTVKLDLSDLPVDRIFHWA
ncbi:MAG: Gfo/Idh/MocA family protein [Anaerolineaceae bacterium]